MKNKPKEFYLFSDHQPRGEFTVRDNETESREVTIYGNFWEGLDEFMTAIKNGRIEVTLTFKKIIDT